MHISIFEAIMLLCFGLAWPFSIYKSLKSKSTKGKSLFFSIIVMIGYFSGIIHKILHSRDIVMFLYVLNFLMVTIDTFIYFRNLKIEKDEIEKSQKKSQTD